MQYGQEKGVFKVRDSVVMEMQVECRKKVLSELTNDCVFYNWQEKEIEDDLKFQMSLCNSCCLKTFHYLWVNHNF